MVALTNQRPMFNDLVDVTSAGLLSADGRCALNVTLRYFEKWVDSINCSLPSFYSRTTKGNLLTFNI